MTSDNPTLPPQSPVLGYGSTQFDMPSEITGRTYRIFVFKPPLPPPPTGFPVVTVIDANMSFPIAATMAATFGMGGKAAMVIGVGYASDDVMELIRLRNRDLTPPTPLSGIRQNPGRPAPKLEDYGGSEDFYRFLIEELRPAIAGAYSVDAGDQTLYGHSLGGLFTLGVLFNHPDSFRNFVASSPSIFWNERSVLGDERRFAAKVAAGEAKPRVLILVGAKEQDLTESVLPGASDAQMKKLMREWRMVDNARDLANRLRRIKGAPDYQARFHAFQDEDHLTVLAASIGRALTFALRPQPPQRSWLNWSRASQAAAPADAVEPSPGDENAVVDGVWNVSVNSPMGVQEMKLILKTNGAALTGTAIGGAVGAEGTQEIASGKVNGGAVAWQMSITQPMKLTLNFSGMVKGDSLSGTVKAGAFASFPFSAVRAEPLQS
jgi:predicted alpha/beta superfamily hydrolase